VVPIERVVWRLTALLRHLQETAGFVRQHIGIADEFRKDPVRTSAGIEVAGIAVVQMQRRAQIHIGGCCK
jgi:hypothetical protein